MLGAMPRLIVRHVRFYAAILSGLAAFGIARVLDAPAPALIGGDIFFLVFLVLCLLLARETPKQLAKRAAAQDDGIVVVVLVTQGVIGFFCEAVFVALAHDHALTAPLLLAGIGAPLGWCVLHCAMAFHYANLHYFDDPKSPGFDLEFPGKGEPGPWDFLYFSFVIGMTAQVSDVQVRTTVMRRAVLGHGLVSFFFNTVFIAMAVNAAVAMAG